MSVSDTQHNIPTSITFTNLWVCLALFVFVEAYLEEHRLTCPWSVSYGFSHIRCSGCRTTWCVQWSTRTQPTCLDMWQIAAGGVSSQDHNIILYRCVGRLQLSAPCDTVASLSALRQHNRFEPSYASLLLNMQVWRSNATVIQRIRVVFPSAQVSRIRWTHNRKQTPPIYGVLTYRCPTSPWDVARGLTAWRWLTHHQLWKKNWIGLLYAIAV